MADRHMRRSARWKVGKSELICLHGGLRFPHIGYVTSCVLNIDDACSATHNDCNGDSFG